MTIQWLVSKCLQTNYRGPWPSASDWSNCCNSFHSILFVIDFTFNWSENIHFSLMTEGWMDGWIIFSQRLRLQIYLYICVQFNLVLPPFLIIPLSLKNHLNISNDALRLSVGLPISQFVKQISQNTAHDLFKLQAKKSQSLEAMYVKTNFKIHI